MEEPACQDSETNGKPLKYTKYDNGTIHPIEPVQILERTMNRYDRSMSLSNRACQKHGTLVWPNRVCRTRFGHPASFSRLDPRIQLFFLLMRGVHKDLYEAAPSTSSVIGGALSRRPAVMEARFRFCFRLVTTHLEQRTERLDPRKALCQERRRRVIQAFGLRRSHA